MLLYATGKKKKDDKKPSTPQKGKKPGAEAGTTLDGVFVMNPQSMDLKIDETQELFIYAFPTEVIALYNVDCRP